MPSSFCSGGPVCPLRKRALHAEHSVCGPVGPGPTLPAHWRYVLVHHSHAQSPLSQKRLLIHLQAKMLAAAVVLHKT